MIPFSRFVLPLRPLCGVLGAVDAGVKVEELSGVEESGGEELEFLALFWLIEVI